MLKDEYRVIVYGIIGGLLAVMGDVLVDSHLYGKSVLRNTYLGQPEELYIYFSLFSIFTIFGLLASKMIKRRKLIENELRMAKEEVDDRVEQRTFELSQAEKRISRHLRTQNTLRSLLEISLNSASLEKQLNESLTLILSSFGHNPQQKGSIFLADNNMDTLKLTAAHGLKDSQLISCRDVSFGECLCGMAAETGKIQFYGNIEEKEEHLFKGNPPCAQYAVPILSGGQVIGVMNIYVEEGHKRTEEECGFLFSVANTIATLIERKKSDEALDKLVKVVNQVGEGIIVTDLEGNIEYVNPGFENITGYSKEEVIGKNPRFLQSGKHDDAFYMEMWSKIKSGISWEGRLINKKKSGAYYYEEATISPIKDDSGSIINYAAIKKDISKEVSLETQLVHTQRMDAVGQLAGGIAHDFNNILTAIIGFSSYLKMKMDEDDPLKIQVEQILSASEKAAALTQGLLVFSRKETLNLNPVKLGDTVSNVEKLIRRLISEEIEISFKISEKDLPVMADEGQLEQIIINLATNARDAMYRGGLLSISVEPTVLDERYIKVHGYGKVGPYGMISISDTGTGMDEETRKRIFEPFFTTKDLGKGTGLGLSIVYGIIKHHGGFINVYSEPGEGTTFKIYLPLTETSEYEKKEVLVLPTGGIETILYAEDDENARISTKGILEEFGYKVIEAVDGVDAINIFNEKKDEIDLLVFDVIMPGKNGIDAYKEIAEIKPGIKVFFTSGYPKEIVEKKKLLGEEIPLLSKPISPNAILTKIRETLH